VKKIIKNQEWSCRSAIHGSGRFSSFLQMLPGNTFSEHFQQTNLTLRSGAPTEKLMVVSETKQSYMNTGLYAKLMQLFIDYVKLNLQLKLLVLLDDHTTNRKSLLGCQHFRFIIERSWVLLSIRSPNILIHVVHSFL
jgi:hypothetical protein